jgi:Spy/CpxP family protein refolding chaperone
MKLAFVVTAVLAFPLMVAAQTNVTVAPRTNPQGIPAGVTAPDFPFPSGFNPTAGLLDQFWNDPNFTAELHLTDVQRKQLKDAALTQRLALIDSGADALKAFTRLSALLEADQLDNAAYKQQLDILAATAGKFVVGVGEMTVSPRRILTLEQWRKLQSLQRAKRTAVGSALPARQPTTHTVPESLRAPIR